MPNGKRRADAERNITAILDAALACFGSSPAASMTEIAAAAGVGRVTLYGHFPSRDALIGALMERALAVTAAALDAAEVDEGPADQAVARVVRLAWRHLDRYRAVLAAATGSGLAPDTIRDRHGAVLDRVDRLVERGQAGGAFRTDLPRSWLITAFYTLMHAAAQEVDAGRLAAGDAAGVLERTVLALLRG
ncbi:MAG: TetR/AcrR family transcriptional regulator [Mycobacteriales bacterium]